MEFVVTNIVTYIRGDADEIKQFLPSLKELLSVYADNYKHSTQYKLGRWDGKICFLKKNNFPTGLLPYILKWFVKNFAIPFELVDERINLPKFQKDFNFELGDYELRDYQKDLILRCNNHICNNSFYFPRGIVKAATNAGKNLVIAGAYNNLIDSKLLFIIHNKLIYNQAIEYFSDIFGEVGQINANIFDIRDFTVAMVNTLANRMEESIYADKINDFNTIIVDECHRAGADMYMNVLSQLDAGVRLFFSGTPLNNSSNVKNITITSCSGELLGEIENEELIKRGVSRKPQVNLHLVKENPTPYDRDYAKEYDAKIVNGIKRLRAILELVKANKDKIILITVQKIEHGENIFIILRKTLEDLPCAFIHGDSTDRDEQLKALKEGKINVLISTMILKEGVNIPNIDLLIMAQGGKSVITVKQLIGRALRAKSGHNLVQIHDFYDCGNYVEKHSKLRIEVYQKEGFDIVTDYPANKNFEYIR